MSSISDTMKKFALSNMLTFAAGDIELMGSRFVMVPNDIWSEYFYELKDEPRYLIQFYRLIRAATAAGLHEYIAKKFEFSPNDARRWFTDMIKLQGWGYLIWDEDPASTTGMIHVKNSPVAMYLKGKVSVPCDHMLRADFAAGTSLVHKADIHCIETECEALGAKECKFIYDTFPRLQSKYPELVKQQIGDLSEKLNILQV